MKGYVGEFTPEEQKLREFVAVKRAEYALQQRIDKQRWEQEVLVPAVKDYQRQLKRGKSKRAELTSGA